MLVWFLCWSVGWLLSYPMDYIKSQIQAESYLTKTPWRKHPYDSALCSLMLAFSNYAVQDFVGWWVLGLFEKNDTTTRRSSALARLWSLRCAGLPSQRRWVRGLRIGFARNQTHRLNKLKPINFILDHCLLHLSPSSARVSFVCFATTTERSCCPFTRHPPSERCSLLAVSHSRSFCAAILVIVLSRVAVDVCVL